MLQISARFSRYASQWQSILIPFFALGGLAFIYLGTARVLTIETEGASRTIRTHARTVKAALQDAGIQPGPLDRVHPSPETSTSILEHIRLLSAQWVEIETPQGRETILSPETIPANILGELGITLLPGDRVWVDGLEVADPASPLLNVPITMVYQPGKRVVLQSSGTDLAFQTSESSIEAILQRRLGYLYEADLFEVERGGEGAMSIRYEASHPITIAVDGESLQSRTAASSTRDVLLESGVVLTGLDRTEPALHEASADDGILRVVRVSETVSFEEEPVPFDIIYEAVGDLEIDNQRILDPGSYGIIAQRLRTQFENGSEVARRSEGEWMAVPPVPRTIGYGSQIVVRTTGTDDGTIEYWRTVEMWATSYSPSRAGVSPDAPNFGITASGAPLTKGLVAIDRNLIPFGTRLYVPGYGFATAADTGGGVKGKWIDLGYDDDNWVGWAQYVTVYFLTPVPAPGSIVWIFP